MLSLPAIHVANSKVISTHQPGCCREVYLHKAVLVSHCAVFPLQPAAPFSAFVFLFNIHKCNPLNLKLFPARVNECNHKPMVAKPLEHINKSVERKRGSKKKRGGGTAEGGVEQNWNLFPLRSPCSPKM